MTCSKADEPVLDKYQPCGCVICTCEDDVQCQGCGARHCGRHPIGELSDPVYVSAEPVKVPSDDLETLRMMRAEYDPGNGPMSALKAAALDAAIAALLARYGHNLTK